MIKGHVRQVKKLLASGTSIIEIEVPVESHIAATMALDGRDVFVDDCANHNDTKSLDQPYGVVDFGQSLVVPCEELEQHAEPVPGSDDLESPQQTLPRPQKPLPKPWGELKRSAQAAILGQEAEFITWIGAEDEQDAKQRIYQRIGCASRRELDDEEFRGRWDDTVKHYKAMKHHLVVAMG
tara:strand:+ start:4480 stop:5022 length:543 start_codon:yes stop_codon:yes gene_type:complete